jgi:ankyrin repeat protein
MSLVTSDLLAAVYRGDDAARDAILAVRVPHDVFEAAAVGDTGRLGALLDLDPSLAGAYAEDGFTPLHLAVFFRHVAAARLLVHRGAPLEAVAGNASRVRPLHSAAAGADLECVRLLLEAGAEPGPVQHGGYTPLHAVAQHGDAEGVRLLLLAGADRHARTDAGESAADLARAAGHDEVAALLEP